MTPRKSSKPSTGDASDQLQLATIILDALTLPYHSLFYQYPLFCAFSFFPFSMHVRMVRSPERQGCPCRSGDRTISPYPLNAERATAYVHDRKHRHSRKLSLLSFCHG